MTKEQARLIVQELVERYRELRDEYHSAEYNEAKLRQDFINPFFKALGWDIDNEKGASENYREVIVEDRVRVRGNIKAPDYGFRLAGSGKKRLFYLEVKKPAVKIKVSKEPAYQLRRYGSSAQVPVSILTNFEDFIIYDCTKVPKVNDSATTAKLELIHFEKYPEKFDFIYDTFSHDAVTRGRFDKYTQGTASKRGTDALDKRFVQSLDDWRKYLAASIALGNKKIDSDELNYAVQLLIDRLIFLRFCEDRLIEPYGQLQKAVSKGNAYQHLIDLFQAADDKYNSGLFDFEKDTVTPGLKIDSNLLRNIIEELYYPKCNYEFSVMPVEILGNAYEQFLGKVIRITPSRHVKIEEKPEVRKAGGVYYTPQYIVDYIVKNTLGKLIEGKSPKEIEKIKIVDPACGSGSFLLGAFEYLLNYHLNWYHQNGYAGKKAKDNPLTPQNTLTTEEKKRILRSSIFGVDLDANAVEVTKLSLLLKCMEGETEASIRSQVALFHERVLPDLDQNIKDGNSLIDTDFYDSEFDLGFEKKIKPFNWKIGFPDVFKQGGFDVVIGNPPYDVMEKERLGDNVPHAALQNYAKSNDSYKQALGGKLNLYRFFVVKFIRLAKEDGSYGLIIPLSILADASCTQTRQFIMEHTKNLEVDCFPQKDNVNKRVFHDAKLSTTIIIGNKSDEIKPKHRKATIRTYPANSFNDECKKCVVKYEDLKLIDPENLPIPLIDSVDWALLLKLHSTKGVTNMAQLQAHFIVRRGEINQTIYRAYIQNTPNGAERLIKGVQIGQYQFKTKLSQGEVEWFNEKLFLKGNNPKPIANVERIATQRITGVDEKLRLVATIIQPKAYFADSTNSIHVGEKSPYDIRYILALINSSLFQWRFKLTSTNNNVGTNELESLPIKTIDFQLEKEKEKHAFIVRLVSQLVDIYKEGPIKEVNNQLHHRVEHLKNKIDQLVYELYGLTEEEIKIVEGGNHE